MVTRLLFENAENSYHRCGWWQGGPVWGPVQNQGNIFPPFLFCLRETLSMLSFYSESVVSCLRVVGMLAQARARTNWSPFSVVSPLAQENWKIYECWTWCHLVICHSTCSCHRSFTHVIKERALARVTQRSSSLLISDATVMQSLGLGLIALRMFVVVVNF